MSEGILPVLIAGIILVALTAYTLLGGADFGGGVWDLLASGPRRDKQRELIEHAISPVWEANHVWLILAVVLLFTCFPSAFARVTIALHIPITLALVGIVLRGSAFTFRAYETRYSPAQHRWGRIFSVASMVTPFLLGVSVGAIASGRVEAPGSRGFVEAYVAPWLTPFALSTGLLAVVLFAFIAAVYLTVEAKETALREDFRRRALGAGITLFIVAGLTLVTALRDAPLLRVGLLFSSRAIPVHFLTGTFAVTALWSLLTRRWRLARVAVAAQATCILWGWGAAQYPYLLPPDLTIAEAAAPAVTLRLVLVAVVLGACLLLPSLRYLFRVFKSA